MQNLKMVTINNDRWQIKKVEDCFLEIINGTTTQQNEADGIPVTRIETIQKSKFDLNRIKYIKNPPQQIIDRYMYINGDIALSHINSLEHVGKVAIYEGTPELFLHGMNLLRLRPNPEILFPKYAFYYMLSNLFRSEVKKRVGKAVNQVSLNQSNLKEIPFLVPPLANQKLMVSGLEDLLPFIDKTADKLTKAKLLLKNFKQAVLSAAVTGKLTQDWRTKNKTISKVNLSSNTFNGQTGLPEIPHTWTWAVLGNVADIRGGVTKGRNLGNKKTISLPYLRVANVQDGYLDLKEMKKIEIPIDEEGRYLLHVGDILFTEGGDRDKLGRGAIWGGEIKNCIHQNHIFRARLTTGEVIPDFISLITKSNYAREYFFLNASQTVNLASINLTTLKNTPIGLPPAKEQKEIMRKVQQYFDIANQVEEQIRKAEAKVAKLTQAILSKTFKQ